MREETLNELKKYQKEGDYPFTNSPLSTWQKNFKKDAKKGVEFILKLRKKGVPLEQINVSDWSSAPIIVYVGNKKYYRFSDFDLNNAIKKRQTSKTIFKKVKQ